MSDTPGQHALDYVREYFPRLLHYVEANPRLRGDIIGALGSVIGDWWDCEGVDCPKTSLSHLCNTFQSLIEEDYLATQVIPEPLSAPPVITDPVITDILLPVRDEEEWKRDEGIMAQLKNLCSDEQFPLEERARFIRLYELALAGWSYTFYRKGD